MGEYLNQRRAYASARLKKLQDALGGETLTKGVACVYVTGSYGREEAGENSDVDLFITGTAGQNDERDFKVLDEICLKADLIKATRAVGFDELSKDGEYLQHHSIAQLVRGLGKPDDDAKNTFTARLLLLLESRVLIGQAVYEKAISKTIESYWGDFEDHRDEFIPAFLVNDILRLWRTFCVNYEARTKSESDDDKAKRKLKNYKLKHSRLLTCYSAIAHLLAVHRDKRTVTPDDALTMTLLTPTERIENLVSTFRADTTRVGDVLERYESFLRATDEPEPELVQAFQNDPEFSRTRFEEARLFGDAVAALLSGLGEGNRLYRILVV